MDFTGPIQSARDEIARATRRAEGLAKVEAALVSVPGEAASGERYGNAVYLTVIPKTAAEAREMVSHFLNALPFQRFLRHVSPYSGDLSYVSEIKHDDLDLHVTITNAEVAPNCQLVVKTREVPASEQKYYVVECGDGSEPEEEVVD